MASGKSFVGKQLSNVLNVPHIDLDDYIEEQLKTSITEIFSEKGEIFFRLKENEYLKKLLESKDDFILSLGGGTPCYAGNMDLIHSYSNVNTIYLRTSIKTICDRLASEKAKRPIVAKISNDDLPEFIAKHLFERSFFYEKANYKITTDNKQLEKIVEEALLLL